jgi:hypothetical protein
MDFGETVALCGATVGDGSARPIAFTEGCRGLLRCRSSGIGGDHRMPGNRLARARAIMPAATCRPPVLDDLAQPGNQSEPA